MTYGSLVTRLTYLLFRRKTQEVLIYYTKNTLFFTNIISATPKVTRLYLNPVSNSNSMSSILAATIGYTMDQQLFVPVFPVQFCFPDWKCVVKTEATCVICHRVLKRKDRLGKSQKMCIFHITQHLNDHPFVRHNRINQHSLDEGGGARTLDKYFTEIM